MLLTAYISGTEDATTDYPFKLVTFNLTKRDGTNSYYSVSAPFSDALMDAFEARPAGKIYIERDGVAWESFNVENLQYAKGVFSQSFTITGYRQETNASPATVAVPASAVVSDGQDAQGRLLLDLVPWALAVLPGDTITYQTVSYTVDILTTQVSATRTTQKLTATEVV